MIFGLIEYSTIAALGLLILILAWHRPCLLVCATISAAALLDCFQVGADGLNFGINLYIDDAAAVVLLLAGCLTLVRRRKGFPRDAIYCLAILLLVAVDFARGVSEFGIKAAGNSARDLVVFCAPALTLMMLRPAVQLKLAGFMRLFGIAGAVLCGIAALRWAGLLTMPVGLEDTREVVRALQSDQAMIIGQAFIAVIYLLVADRRSLWWWGAAAPVFGAFTLLLQHRSVWAATLVGLAWLVARTVQSSAARWFTVAGVSITLMGLLIAGNPELVDSVDSLVSSNVLEMQRSDSTWEWRVQGYKEATDRALGGTVSDLLIGPPAGWASSPAESFASVHIHDRYVNVLAYSGVIGLVALLLWFGVLIKRVSKRGILRLRRTRHVRSPVVLQAMLLSELVYLIPYHGGMLQSAVLGLVWLAATEHSASVPSRRIVSFRDPVLRKELSVA